jgi:hypothetical protein
VGALAAWGVAEGDWASVWQAVVVDLFSGGAAWGDSSCVEAAFPASIEACRARGDFARHCGGPIDALDGQVAAPRAIAQPSASSSDPPTIIVLWVLLAGTWLTAKFLTDDLLNKDATEAARTWAEFLAVNGSRPRADRCRRATLDRH